MIKEWLLRRKAEKQVKIFEQEQEKEVKEFKNSLYDRLIDCSKRGVNYKFTFCNPNRYYVEVKFICRDKQNMEVGVNPYIGTKLVGKE